MSRITGVFDKLAREGRRALIPYVTAGDPFADITVDLMLGLARAGADVIELGIPFSDPMADGPVIQRSSEQALRRGAGLRYVLKAVAEFRQRDAETPVVLMGYLNPIEIHGNERFAEEAVKAGVDGVLLVDLPPEEAAETREIFSRHGLDLIALASPTTTPERMAMLCESAQGYLYYVSFAGVTGAGHLDTQAAGLRLHDLRAQGRVPVVAGFGIKDAASAAAMAVEADGVVVGSALVAQLADAPDAADAASRAAAFLAPLRAALDA